MKQQSAIRSAIIVILALAAATVLPSQQSRSFAASNESLTYKGGGQELQFSCGASNYETCPLIPCSCLTSTGSATSSRTGAGFATVDFIVTNPDQNQCQQFNASMFIIATKDLEEVDFSGTSCDGMRTFSGTYTIAVSQAGNSGSGTVSGTHSRTPVRYDLTFQ